ncbi:MAG: DUF3316 domain-containing protein [Bacteroidaceae bacterium]|nr:DUF3316 domain-containing protein [Bacteroidaceae bacterium]
MRFFRYILPALALLVTPTMSRAQHFVCDTIIPERIVVKSSQYGITLFNNLDTYLSNYKFTGLGIHYSHETFRDVKTGNHKWKYQRLLNGDIGYGIQQYNLQYSGLLNYNWSGYHSFEVHPKLSLLAGIQIQLEGGALYVPGNGNSPVAAKIRTAIAASGMAIYHFRVLKSEWIARYQIDIPLAGVMFAPQYGQSYYEIFGLGHCKGIISFTYPGNCPSWRHFLTLDIPLKNKRNSSTLRIGYTADLFQSNINGIRCHIYKNSFTIGLAKTLFKVKKENKLNLYSPY